MSAGYRQPPTEAPLPAYGCLRHAVRTYGIEDTAGTLVAYLWLYRAGQLALVSQILGHADRLNDEIMYPLMQGTAANEAALADDGYLIYNRYDSGTDGLRFFKDRCGFRPVELEWLP